MSQVTRCPSCGTRFKVVADQLRISQGWVRCGVCQEVFDATQSLHDAALGGADGLGKKPADTHELSESTSVEPFAEPSLDSTALASEDFASQLESDSEHADVVEAQPVQGVAASAPALDNDAAPAGVDVVASEPVDESMAELQEPVAHEDAAQVERVEASDSLLNYERLELDGQAQEPYFPHEVQLPVAEQKPVDESLADDAVAAQSVLETDAEPQSIAEVAEAASIEPVSAEVETDALIAVDSPVLEAGNEAKADVERVEATSVKAEDTENATLAQEPGFVREAKRKAFWRRPLVRVAVSLGCVLATAALVGQYAWQHKNELAAQYPALDPTLRSMCDAMGCTLQARQAVSDLVITSSGFKRLQDGQSYQLSLSLENRSTAPVATPAVELTLHDDQDRPLLRRVINLQELGAPAQLGSRGEWSVAVPVQVQGLGALVAGYRALVFYP